MSWTPTIMAVFQEECGRHAPFLWSQWTRYFTHYFCSPPFGWYLALWLQERLEMRLDICAAKLKDTITKGQREGWVMRAISSFRHNYPVGKWLDGGIWLESTWNSIVGLIFLENQFSSAIWIRGDQMRKYGNQLGDSCSRLDENWWWPPTKRSGLIGENFREDNP